MSYNLQLRNNCYIITGGPGAGKSTLIDAFAQRGYQTVAEVGRQIILEELATGGNALHTADRLAFRERMLMASIADYQKIHEQNKPIFFDRGIPDLIGYSYLIKHPVPSHYWQATQKLRYNPTVFIAPPWIDIYQQDSERKQDFQEAIDTYEAIKKGYQDCDYILIELPKVSVEQRIAFMFEITNNVSPK
ncbi:AAA family ATPase [Candidatus Berkiella aquae]|uniref:AAA family ATPase n=1 Tax=Candidatus Berkiella aquae TaxID=295108 RepID=A0A0Q9YGN4_9GAMM|nr:AAA family ATPase [Candidatus Berkiella aquae]MCS5710779.1 AAA family ATPase [Candidatus Berkiella aquae]